MYIYVAAILHNFESLARSVIITIMIGWLSGDIIDIKLERSYLILNVGGVGYVVYTSAQTLLSATVGDSLTIHTHTVVRETALDLYGFNTAEEKALFELLLSVSGVGPKSALSILSLADTSTIYNAISRDETSYLTKVSGIGKKLAGKIVLELKDKIGDIGKAGDSTTSDDSSVMEALEAMGYKVQEAREAIKSIPSDTTGLNARVSAALKALSNQ